MNVGRGSLQTADSMRIFRTYRVWTKSTVQTFDPSASGTLPAEAVMISKDGGHAARWSADGREIFYRSLNGDVMYVEVSTTPVFRPLAPRLLFKAPLSSASQLLFFEHRSRRTTFSLCPSCTPEFDRGIYSRPELVGSAQALAMTFYKLKNGRCCGWAAVPPKRKRSEGTTMAAGRDFWSIST